MSIDVEPDLSLDEARIREMVEGGNIPTLLAALYQLTGDDRWLSDEFRPQPTRGFEEDDSGGLPQDALDQIHEGAVQAVRAWANGAAAAVPNPSGEEMVRLMSRALGEPVGPEFAPMIARHLGFDRDEPEDLGQALRASGREFSVLVIGAGFSGLAAAAAMQQRGIPYTVLEKNEEVGGTWLENQYPGARVDTPTSLYSFNDLPGEWDERFSVRDSVLSYLTGAADRLRVRDQIRFGQEVTELRWDDATYTWTATTRGPGGEVGTFTASAVITAVGLHNRPNIPEYEGADEFKGEIIHSARWHDGVSLKGKRVAVVGSGATSMQLVAAIADEVEELTVVQRSAHWVIPISYYFKPLPEPAQWLSRHFPYYRLWSRFRTYWFFAERIYPALVVDPTWDRSRNSVNAYSEANRKYMTAYIKSQLEGRDDLIEKCTPKFPPFGKRLLVDNGWYATLKRPNASLVTEDIERLTPDGFVTTSGEHVAVDTLVLCTGFQQQRILFPMNIYGVQGRALHEEWQGDDARAYLAMTSPGFPNLFYLFGPNSNPPGGSWVTVAEDQVRYITQVLESMIRDDIAALDVKQERYEEQNAQVDQLAGELLTSLPGVDSYYRNARGRVVTNSPYTVLEYWELINQPNLDDFNVTPASMLSAR